VIVAQTLRFDSPKMEEARPFQLSIPAEPYSFSGKLISLIWALEVVVEPAKEGDRLEITVSPNGDEISLHKNDRSADVHLHAKAG
jgi:hypothetical protein